MFGNTKHNSGFYRFRRRGRVKVRLEWRWEDSSGKVHEDDDSKRLTLLGVNEYVFSNLGKAESDTWQDAFNNAPLLAAWVSRNDPVVKQFAAMANKGKFDEKVPALRFETPREAVRSPEGRERLEALLAQFEWQGRRAPEPELAPDVAALRARLGL